MLERSQVWCSVLPVLGAGTGCGAGGLKGSPAVGLEIGCIPRETSCLSLKSDALCGSAPSLGEGCSAIAVLN